MVNTQNRKGAIMLIAPEFDEERTIICVSRLRQAGITVDLISIQAGIVRGHRGVALRADASLEEFSSRALPFPLAMIILCGQQECAARLMADPRVHQLMRENLEAQGKLVCLASDHHLWTQIFQTTNDAYQWLTPGNTSFYDFVDQLVIELIA